MLLKLQHNNATKLQTSSSGVTVTGDITSDGFIKSGGTSSQYLMADGSTTTSGGGGGASVLEWTLGANGTSDYTFDGPGLDGVQNDPTLYLTRGETYKFTNNMNAHPFRIQSTPGTSGTPYNDGVTNNGVSNGTLEWKCSL